MAPDAKEVLFGQELIQRGLVDPADDAVSSWRSRMHLVSVNEEVRT